MSLLEAMSDLAQVGEGPSGVGPQGGHGHDAPQPEVLALADQIGEWASLRRRDAAPSWGAVERDLEEDVESTTRDGGCPVERMDEARPVDRLDDVGVPGNRGGLVGLHLSDEVDIDRRGRVEAGDLVGRLLVAALTDLADPELGKEVDVARREKLGHDDQGGAVHPPTRLDGGVDPVAGPSETGSE